MSMYILRRTDGGGRRDERNIDSGDIIGSRSICPFHQQSGDSDLDLSLDFSGGINSEGVFNCHSTNCGAKGQIHTPDQVISYQMNRKKKESNKDIDSWVNDSVNDIIENDSNTDFITEQHFAGGGDPKNIDFSDFQDNEVEVDIQDKLFEPEHIPEKKKKPKTEVDYNNIVRDHIYRDKNNHYVHRTVYYGYKNNVEGKRPLQQRWENEGWDWGLTYTHGEKKNTKVQKILYNLPNLIKSDSQVLYYVEGEKDCDTLIKLNITNVTTLGSSGESLKDYHLESFKDKEIVIIPDDDAAGKIFTQKLIDFLLSAGINNISICHLPFEDSDQGKDISDYIIENNIITKNEVQNSIEKYTKPYNECPGIYVVQPKVTKKNSLAVASEAIEKKFGGLCDFPISSLPKLMQEFIYTGSKGLGTTYEYVGTSLIGLFSGATGTNYGARLTKSWTQPDILWIVNIGDNGNKKTDTNELVWAIANPTRLKLEVKNKKLEAQYIKDIKLYDTKVSNPKNTEYIGFPPVVPQLRKLRAVDITYEKLALNLSRCNSGVSVGGDELPAWFESIDSYAKNSSGKAFYLKGYDGNSSDYERVSHGSMTIERVHINVFGFAQRGLYNDMLNKKRNIIDGFAPRFLVYNIPPIPMASDPESVVSDCCMNKMQEIYSAMINIEQSYADDINTDKKEKRIPITIYHPFSDEAQKEWDKIVQDFYDFYNNNVLDSKHPFTSWLNKYLGKFGRLCHWVHKIRYFFGEKSSIDEMDIKDIEIAKELIDFFSYHDYNTIMNCNKKDSDIPNDKEYQKITRWIIKNKEPMDITRMIQNRIFQNVKVGRAVLDKWIELDLMCIYDNKYFIINFN